MGILDICQYDGERGLCTETFFLEVARATGLGLGDRFDVAHRLKSDRVALWFRPSRQYNLINLQRLKLDFKHGVAKGLKKVYSCSKPDDRVEARLFASVVEEIGSVSLSKEDARKINWSKIDDEKVAELLIEEWKL